MRVVTRWCVVVLGILFLKEGPKALSGEKRTVLTVRDAHKAWDGERRQLSGASFTVKEGQRVVLSGDNGCGKSTLLKVIAQKESLDKGTCEVRRGLRVVMVDQDALEDVPEKTVRWALYERLQSPAAVAMREYERALENVDDESSKVYEAALEKAERLGAWRFEEAINAAVERLGLAAVKNDDDDSSGSSFLERKLGDLSGGERKRVALAAAIAAEPDILVLDEPTNHVDVWGVRWLEDYLTDDAFRRTLLFVSHDRLFARNVATALLELDDGNVYEHFATRSQETDSSSSSEEDLIEIYLKNRAKRIVDDQKATAAARTRLKRELAWLRRGAKARQTKSTNRVAAVQSLQADLGNKKKQRETTLFSSLPEKKRTLKSSDVLLEIVDLEAPGCFAEFGDYRVGYGAKIGVVGANGSGKSSLVRRIVRDAQKLGQLLNHDDDEPSWRLSQDDAKDSDSEDSEDSSDLLCRGEVKFAGSAKVAYLSQNDAQKKVLKKKGDDDERLFDWAVRVVSRRERHPTDLADAARELLTKFAFDADQQTTYVSSLSGGERRRMQLAAVLDQPCDLLVMDEPSNDLDLNSLQALERFLCDDFTGALFLVSHDRALLDAVCDDGLLVLPGDGYVASFSGSMSDYLDLLADQEKTPRRTQDDDDDPEEAKRRRNAPRDIRKLQDQIGAKESALADLDARLAEHGTDLHKLQDLYKDRVTIENAIDDLYSKWEDLEALLD